MRAWASSAGVRASTRRPSVSEGELAEVPVTYLKNPTAWASVGRGHGRRVRRRGPSRGRQGPIDNRDRLYMTMVIGLAKHDVPGQMKSRSSARNSVLGQLGSISRGAWDLETLETQVCISKSCWKMYDRQTTCLHACAEGQDGMGWCMGFSG